MCSTTFLTALDRIVKLLMELIKTEMKARSPRLDAPEANYARICNRSDNNKAICIYCRKRGHERRRCYHATACFKCSDTDHFVKHCPLKRALSSLTDPSPGCGSGSDLRYSVASGLSSRKRNSFRASRRAFEPSRPLPIFDLQCSSAVVDQPGAASVSIYSSPSLMTCSESSLSTPSRALPSSYRVTASRVLAPDYISRLCIASLDDLKPKDVASRPLMPVSSAGMLCIDRYRTSVVGRHYKRVGSF